MQDLKATLIQNPLTWQDKTANLANFEERIWQITEQPDLIVLPEMFNTGFTMHAQEVAEPMNLTTFKWMKQMAAQTQAVITGSFIVKENHNFYNRLVWMRPDGSYECYDKRHLFRMAGEHEVFSPGKTKTIVKLKGWNILPVVCYDLRFPVWLRNRNNEYDLLICIANWPESRSIAWKSLLQARAIENLSYVIGVNRIGKDGNDISYSGDSGVFSPKGELIYACDNHETIQTAILNKESLDSFRKAFPAWQDADDFTLGN
ncbi:amidohydrolase [Cytophagaceae bacterium ABcell3]|nr:amidohydrolase [Cytophagaceae bacterium ABcell3]